MSTEQALQFIHNIFNYSLFTLNETPVTLTSLIIFVLIFLLFYMLSRFISNTVLQKVLFKLQIDDSIQFTMLKVTHYIIMIIGSVVAFQNVGIDLSGLAVIFGLLSVGIGFGLQNITSNFISGLILLFERPIKVGDRVTIGDLIGDVTEISIRATTVRSLNNISIIVPNTDFVSSQVINWSHGDPKIRVEIDVGVSYNSDLDTVIKALDEVADQHPKVLKTPLHDILFAGFGDSSWNMILRVWINDPKDFRIIRSDLNCEIVRKFKKYNIEIPFPQRDLHLRSPQAVKFIQDSTKN